MDDDNKRPTARSRTGKERRSGIDTRSAQTKAQIGERRSGADRRSEIGGKAKPPGKPKAP